MRLIRMAKPLLLALTLCVTSAVATVLAEGNDFVIGDLRVDLSEVYNARDYKVNLLANDKPGSGSDDDFTTAWLGVFLAQYIPGVPDSGQFSQVGLLTKKDGIRWFVYAEPTVTCLEGWHDPEDDRHCYGFIDEIVTLGSWHQVELVKYPQNNYWIARVYSAQGTPYDVAKIWSDSSRIYKARSDTEEGYIENLDPYLTANFYHWHPQYMKWGTGWQEWPESSGDNCNSIWTVANNGPDPCPDHYGADPYWTGDPRAWFAGTDGKWCDVDPLFSATYTYLPDIKANYNGGNSTIIVRNNGDGDAHVQVAFYDSNGNIVAYPINTSLASQDIWILDAFTEVSGFDGSAVVTASEDVSVVVENQYDNSRSYAYNGIAASDPLNPDWGQVGTTLYAPVIMNNYWGWYTDLVLRNAGSATANVNVWYYSSNGSQYGPYNYSLPPNGSRTINYGGAANTLYSARIVSGQPLAAVVRQYKFNPYVYLTYNCLSAGASPVYAPLIMNNYYGWDTSVNVQNTGDSTAFIHVRYYNTSGYQVGQTDDEIPPYASDSYYSPSEGLPDSFIGTAHISSVQPLAVVVNQSSPRGSPTRGMSYDGTSNDESTYVVLPDVLNYYGGENWVSSVNVQNLGISDTVATLTYAGQSVDSPTINPYGFYSFYVPTSGWGENSLRGPATVSSYSAMAVVVNHSSVISTTVDLARSYNGYNREPATVQLNGPRGRRMIRRPSSLWQLVCRLVRDGAPALAGSYLPKGFSCDKIAIALGDFGLAFWVWSSFRL